MLYRLQMLRAWAAISVMALHYLPALSMQFPSLAWIHIASEQICFAGVDVFFVISGYIVTRMYYEEGLPAGKYLLKRLVRIFSGYWLVLALFLLLHPLIGLGTEQYKILKAAFLLPPGVAGYPLKVAWSLRYEVVFYALFALGAAWVPREKFRYLLYAAVPLAGAYFLAYIFQVTSANTFEFVLVNPYLLEFMAGSALYFLPARTQGEQMLWLGLACLVVAALVNYTFLDGHMIRHPQRVLRVFLLLPGAAMLVAWAVAQNPLPKSLMSKALVRMGDASFMLYLAHIPVGITTTLLLGKGDWMILLPVEAVALSLIISHYAEKPSYRFLCVLLGLKTAPLSGKHDKRLKYSAI